MLSQRYRCLAKEIAPGPARQEVLANTHCQIREIEAHIKALSARCRYACHHPCGARAARLRGQPLPFARRPATCCVATVSALSPVASRLAILRQWDPEAPSPPSPPPDEVFSGTPRQSPSARPRQHRPAHYPRNRRPARLPRPQWSPLRTHLGRPTRPLPLALRRPSRRSSIMPSRRHRRPRRLIYPRRPPEPPRPRPRGWGQAGAAQRQDPGAQGRGPLAHFRAPGRPGHPVRLRGAPRPRPADSAMRSVLQDALRRGST